jgi:hypothetical protein
MKTSRFGLWLRQSFIACTLVEGSFVIEARGQTNCVPVPTGLVSWWRAEGNAFDHTGLHHGTNVNNASFGPGHVGQAFVFDGLDDAVNLGSPAGLQLQNFTIEGWVRRFHPTRATQGTQTSGSLFSGSTGAYGFGMLDDGRLFLTKVGVSAVFTTAAITDTNAFHHVAVTKSGSTVTVYVDGVGESVGPYDPGFTFTGPMAIGARGGDYVGSFYGAIDELTIYNRALAANEIQAIFNVGSTGKCAVAFPPVITVQPTNQTVGLGGTATFQVAAIGTPPLAYQWQFNSNNLPGATGPTLNLIAVQTNQAGIYLVIVSNSAGVAVSSNAMLTVLAEPACLTPPSGLVGFWKGDGDTLDWAGTNHGVLGGNATFGPGRVGQAFVSDGSGDGVRVGNPGKLQIQDLTIELWVKRASPTIASQVSTDALFFGFGSGGYGFGINNDGRLFLTRVDVDNVTISTGVTDTNFHHVAVTKSGTNVFFYIDGVAVSAPPYSTTFTFSSSAAIGARGDTLGNSFYGSMDEVSVYNRALSAAEIQAIFNAGAVGKCAAPLAPVILTQPRSTNALVGGSVTFTVVAGGTQPLGYQWRFNDTNLPGAMGASLILTNVQLSHAGAYSVLVTNAVGSVLSSNATLTVVLPPVVVRIGSTNVMAGRSITLPVLLTANGNENGFGFSLSFNTQRLAFVSATLGSGATGATLIVNSSLAATGRVGVAVAFPPQRTFAPGTQEVARLRFDTLPLTGVSPVTVTNSFADQPIPRELYDAQLQTLSAFYSNGVVTLQPTVFEGDVYPRPNGNQALTSTDWSQAGRLAARLDVATAGSEFQRADCAPRATLGDGQIKVTDWVQTGRYLAGLDPLNAVGGPSVETFVPASSSPVSRQIRVWSTNALHGQTVSLAVTLEAQGDENAVGFTLSFNPEAFVFAGLNAGADAGGANFIPNTSDAASGRVGVAMAWPTGLTPGAGTLELARLQLMATPNFAGPQPVSLSDQVVTRCASDVFAGELPVNWVGGLVTVVPPNPNPALGIVATDTNVTLYWPRWAADFTLQMRAGSDWTSGPWSNLSVALQTNVSAVSATLPLAEGARFFRLFRP